MRGRLTNIVWIFSIIILGVFLISQSAIMLWKVSFDIAWFGYWAMLLFWAATVTKHRAHADISMKVGFVLLALGGIISAITSSLLGEMILRIGFLGWMVGLSQHFFNVIKKSNND